MSSHRHKGPHAYRPILGHTDKHIVLCGCPKPHSQAGAQACAITSQNFTFEGTIKTPIVNLTCELLELDTTLDFRHNFHGRTLTPGWSCTHLLPFRNPDCSGCQGEVARRAARYEIAYSRCESAGMAAAACEANAALTWTEPSL